MSLAYQSWLYTWPVELAYILVVITAFGPVVLDRWSFVAGAPIMLAADGVGAYRLMGATWFNWVVVALAAVLSSAGWSPLQHASARLPRWASSTSMG